MDPVSLGIAGTEIVSSALSTTATAATGIGAITSAIGSVLGGVGQKNMFNYQAGVADVNRKIALQNADYARKVGESKALESGLRTRDVIARTITQQGASGLDVNRGSAVGVRESEAEIGRYDQAVIRANAAKQAYGYEVQAMQDTAQGQLFRMAGTQAEVAGGIGAFGSLLSGAGAVSSKWLQGLQYGLGSSSSSLLGPTLGSSA